MARWASLLGRVVNGSLQPLRIRIVRQQGSSEDTTLTSLSNVEPEFAEVLARVAPFTMTSAERIYSMWQATRYVARQPIEGAIVECGVWRGGSMMTAALALMGEGSRRQLFLFDTFAGMVPPTEMDLRFDGERATDCLAKANPRDPSSEWCIASLEEVRGNIESTGYPLEQVQFVEGPVEETIPVAAPDQIALLRLDTDWYQSTLHELECLFDRISPGGVLIIDDYGWWRGARNAVQEFLNSRGLCLLLHRIDETGRVAVLPR
jgi:O-methyltransferase